jgi:hypothetical protein
MSPLTRIALLGALSGSAAFADISAFNGIGRHAEPSTATFRWTTLDLPGSHLAEDTVAYSVEANIAPSFTVFEASGGERLPGAYRVTVTPQFVVRRSDGVPSNPVRTPSYIPAVTLFYGPRDSLGGAGNAWYASFTVSHYSNGQTGSFYQPDGRTLNTLDGSFSLWSAAAAVHLVNDWPLLPEYKALQLKYVYGKEGGLDALYPDYVVSARMQTADHLRARALIDLDWMVRKGGARPDALKPVPFSGAFTGVYAPGRPFSALALFARFYAGIDNYNMNFDKEIYRLDLGLMIGPF